MNHASAVTVRDIARQLETWAPPLHAESYDNVGLLVGSYDQPVTGVMINLDMTENVVEEAIRKGCNMVVAHHPIWFGAKKRLIAEDYVSKTIIRAIKHDVHLYAIHTNLDNMRHGVNHRMAGRLGLEHCRILKPSTSYNPDIGSGMIGDLPEAMSQEAFLQHVREAFHCQGIRYAEPEPAGMIRRVAICGGAGAFLTGTALQTGVDAFVTADITYHKFFDNEGRMLLLDIGHYESEQFTSQLIAEYLSENFSTFDVYLSEVYTNPVRYFS